MAVRTIEPTWEEHGPGCPPDRSCVRTRRYARPGEATAYCVFAGHRRNYDMAAMGNNACAGFPLAPFPFGGTWDCMMHAATLDIPVWRCHPDGATERLDRTYLVHGRDILAARRGGRA